MNENQSQNRGGIKITVVSIGKQKEVHVPAGSTNADCLREANFDAQGYSLTLNGTLCQLHERPDDGDIIALTPKIDGGTN